MCRGASGGRGFLFEETIPSARCHARVSMEAQIWSHGDVNPVSPLGFSLPNSHRIRYRMFRSVPNSYRIHTEFGTGRWCTEFAVNSAGGGPNRFRIRSSVGRIRTEHSVPNAIRCTELHSGPHFWWRAGDTVLAAKRTAVRMCLAVMMDPVATMRLATIRW